MVRQERSPYGITPETNGYAKHRENAALNGDDVYHVDPIGQYIRDINEIPLLTREKELQLCQMIERGRTAKAILQAIKEFGTNTLQFINY